MDTLFSNISVITMDERMQVLTDAFVGITDGKIAWLAKKPPEEQPQRIIDGTGMVLMPGLTACHTRLEETLLRGYADDLLRTQKLDKCYPRLEQMDDRAAKASALLGIAQYLRMGVTSVSDLAFHADSVAQAVSESGIKANIAKELILLSEEDYDPELDPGFKELEALHRDWHGHDNGRILVEAGFFAEYTTRYPLWEAAAAFVAEHKLGMQLILSRHEADHEDCLDRNGLTPAQIMNCHHVFDGRVQAAHCGALDEEDMALLGKKETTAVLCPMTERKQVFAQADLAKLVKAGMNVAFGTASLAESGSADLLQQAKTAALDAKMRAIDPSFMPAPSVLLMATVCGAKAQGRADRCGMIKVGFDADLIALDFTQPHLIPGHDLMSSVVYGATGTDVCMTMVQGQILYASGKFPTIDLNALMKELADYAMPQVFTEQEEQDD